MTRDSQWDHEGLFETRKEQKKQRKIASAKDRSKYKKTDAEKKEKARPLYTPSKEKARRGRVVAIASEGIFVDCDNQKITCTLRGVLKKERTLLKNLVVVGDFVWFEPISPEEGVIEHVEPRQSILSRADNISQRREQLIAANIDQVLITVSVVNPPLKPPLVDRYLIAAHKGKMEPILVINKIDLLDSDDSRAASEKQLYEEFLKAYSLAGVPVVSVSMVTGAGLDELRSVMKNKASVFAGQSGVGKSSLINAITGLQLPIGKTVERTRKGSHTTSQAHLIHLDFEGWCIDTPGIKSFGIWDVKAEEVLDYFSEFHPLSVDCKYPNCTHRHEPGCAVEKAIEEGNIPVLRYQSYLALVESIEEEHLRR